MIINSYPFDGPKTREIFPNRLNPSLREGKVLINIDPEVFPDFYKEEQQLTDFLLDRIFDYHNALNVAEQQIFDMSEEYPFIPEDFNFKEDELPEGSSESFINKKFYYNDNGHIITRLSDNEWMITSNTMNPIKLTINNSREAYTTLKALAIITDDEFEPIVTEAS